MQSAEPTSDAQSPAPVVRLGIGDLPGLSDGMNAGGIYALVTEAPPARLPLLAASLAQSTRANRPTTLLLASQADTFIERLSSNGFVDIHQAMATGRLAIYLQQSEFSKKMFRHGASDFVRELKHYGLPDNGYVVFDQADDLLSLNDVSMALEQIHTLQTWAESTGNTLLLSFNQVAASPKAMATLTSLMDDLSGIAKLSNASDGLEVVFDYWQSPEGTVAARSFPIQLFKGAGYRSYRRAATAPATASNDEPAHMADPGGDAETRYFYLDPDFSTLEAQLPGAWHYRDSLISLLQGTQGLRSPTVILSFHSNTNLRELAQTVHTLRMSIGRRAKIVVIEKKASLRYPNEALLLRLGVSLVIHRDVPGNRWPLLLESLEGQIFERELSLDFDAALASVSVTPLRGYLPPKRFTQEAALILERATVLNIPSSLVIAVPERDQLLPEILAQCRLSRAGDLVTTDDKNVYLFFSGCPDSALQMTLERALTVSAGTLFLETQSLSRRPDIAASLAALSKHAQETALPDYSEQVANAPDMMADAKPPEAPASTADAEQPWLRAQNQKIRDLSPTSLITKTAAPSKPSAETGEVQSLRHTARQASAPALGKAPVPRASRRTPASDGNMP